jgi:hypothetical protein
MGFFFYMEEEVAWGSIPWAEVAGVAQDEGGIGFYARGEFYFLSAFGFCEAGAAALPARIGIVVAAALAGGAGLIDDLLKEAPSDAVGDLTATSTGRA